MDSEPLTAEEVFLIADPPTTLKTLKDFATPTVKVDLKARLAIELHRRLITSKGEQKDIIRKRLKQLYNDKLSVKEERETLNTILNLKNSNKPAIIAKIQTNKDKETELKKRYAEEEKRIKEEITNLKKPLGKPARDKIAYLRQLEINTKRKISSLHNKNDEMEKDLKNVRDDPQYDRLEELHNKHVETLLKTHTQLENAKASFNSYPNDPDFEEEYEDRKREFAEITEKYKESKDNLESYVKNLQDRPVKLAEKEKELDESIIETSREQQELEDMVKIDLNKNSEINPAAFEKSLAERVAESNELFQNLLNTGQEPHITLPFEAFARFNDINQAFIEPETGRVSNMILIIYRSTETFGHFCCLTRSKDLRKLTYFNSYGSYIDKALDYIPQEFADLSKQNFPYLLKLLNESNYEIHWNDKQLQKMDKRIATCGNWSGLFMRYSRLGKSLEDFVVPFLTVPLEERDEMVLKITKPYLLTS